MRDRAGGGGVNDLLVIDGDLTLDGTLNVADLGNFGVGQYTIIQYTGSLTDNGLETGDLSGQAGLISTGTPGEVRLSLIPKGTLIMFR